MVLVAVRTRAADSGDQGVGRASFDASRIVRGDGYQTSKGCVLALWLFGRELTNGANAGVILYGVPGTGKTLLAKAVANQTSATFLRIVGSELIQKYLGDGPKLVRELFRVAEELAPSIVFIDEIDAIGTKRCVLLFGSERKSV